MNNGGRHFPRTARVFIKDLAQERAQAEIAGWHAVADHLNVPGLIGWTNRRECSTLVYRDVFADRTCSYLLGDLIGIADRVPTTADRVVKLVEDVAADFSRAWALTGEFVPLDRCVPALYCDRIRPGGRIDVWYGGDAKLSTPSANDSGFTLGELGGYDFVVNGVRRVLRLGDIISETRAALGSGRQWSSAITQGDATEPNIAWPLYWLDFEHAGRNVVAGEIANLLWYLLALGGWLVPRYQPATYRRTLRLQLEPVTKPHIRRLVISHRHRRIDLHYGWRVGPGRHAALRALRKALRGELGRSIGASPRDLLSVLRPFLSLRILGVLPITTMSFTDALLCLAKLAELHDPEMDLDRLLETTVMDGSYRKDEAA